jgi:hypothetical protein
VTEAEGISLYRGGGLPRAEEIIAGFRAVIRSAVDAMGTEPSLFDLGSVIELYGCMLRLVVRADHLREVLSHEVISDSDFEEYCVLRDGTALYRALVDFFPLVGEFSDALSRLDAVVLDIYHPGLAGEIASIAGADIDMIKRINGVIAPRYGLDPVDLPPYLVHYASRYLDVPLADMLSRQILGGERHLDIMAEAGIPVFVDKREREMLTKLCDGLRSVRDGLAGLVRDNFSLPQLAAIGTGKTVNLEFVMGDQFSQITNSSIANRSQVTNSFLQLAHGDEELADALARLEIAVRQSGSGDAADSFDAFVAELAKPEPKKSVLRGLWSGLCAALPTAAQIADIAAKLAPLLQGQH